MGVYIKGMKMPESCEMCPIEGCEYINGKFTCPLIEIDDTVWENEKYKLIRMTQEVRINKAMVERRAD